MWHVCEDGVLCMRSGLCKHRRSSRSSRWLVLLSYCLWLPPPLPHKQVARGRAIIPANKRHLELEPTIIGRWQQLAAGWHHCGCLLRRLRRPLAQLLLGCT